MTTIWTRAARDLLYEALVTRFGAHATWENGAWPSAARRREFDEFCDEFAKLVGAKSGAAVKVQIGWGCGTTGEVGERHWDSSHSRNFVLNMASAFEAGFVTHEDFPAVVTQKQAAEPG